MPPSLWRKLELARKKRRFAATRESRLFTDIMELTTVIVRPGEADRIVAGHPWLYHGSIDRLTQPVQDGDLVQVKDHRKRFLGVGVYNSKSKINVRMLGPERLEVNQDFFEQRIGAALALRRKHLPAATSFRVVNAESDFLSGLIIDQYEDVLAIQISSLAMDQRKPMILAALQKLFSPRAILERSDVSSRRFEGLEVASGVLAGKLEGPVFVKMNGLELEIDLLAGHKTGLYLDQQANYAHVAKFARDGVVLDCFSFIGGFALHAAKAQARQVHALDQSADAIAVAARNASRNGVAERCTFDTVNVFDWLRTQTATQPHEKLIPKFDLIILDPPSFTRSRATVPEAMRGYKEIHVRALKLLKTGGALATFCCSHHVDAQKFQAVILEAAFDTRRLLRRIATYAQNLDHPIVPAIPETEYLKGYAFEMVN